MIKTKNKVIAKDYKICNSLWSKARGLMFSKKHNLIFIFNKEQNVSLHMIFVFFPIWVVYLDKDKKVTSIKKLLPFISTYNAKAKYVLELTKKPNIKIGEKVEWTS